jgi:phospholipid/cholesterol/gamma-HCH transport system substrate-binding protein
MKGTSRLSPKAFGAVVLVLFLLVGWAAFQKEKISTYLAFGKETIHAEFAARSKLIGDDLTFDHVVKMNGVVIGKVTTIEETDKGTMIAGLQVDSGTRDKLGTAPTAFIEPTLVTDGVQFVGLATGGDPEKKFTDDMIPMTRTKLPVYLDDVLKAVSAQHTLNGIQSTIRQTDSTLRAGGADAIRGLATDAPATLKPAGVVLDSFRGTNKESDLDRLVTGFESFSSAQNQQDGQFSSMIRSLNKTSTAFGAGSPALSTALAGLPDTLRTSRAGLADLVPTLHKLQDTSDDFRPTARELDDFLHEFGPVLHRARPVFDDLRHLLHDAKPLVDELVPTADVGIKTLDDVKGPVLDRVNGPIKDRIYAPLIGKNEYKGSSNGIPTYKELGYFSSALNDVFKHYDSNSAIARLEAGANGQSLTASKFPKTMEQYLETFGLQQPEGLNDQRTGLIGKIQPNKAKPQDAAPTGLAPKSTPDVPLLGGTR